MGEVPENDVIGRYEIEVNRIGTFRYGAVTLIHDLRLCSGFFFFCSYRMYKQKVNSSYK